MQFGSSNDLYRKSGFGLHQLRNCFSRLAANIRPPAFRGNQAQFM
jgi:hypothetical protein